MPLSFSLSLASEPVELDGKTYTLRELTGRGREQYASMQLAATDGEQVTSVDGLVCGLVALSLVDEGGVPVPREVVDGWPGRVVEALAERVRVLSKLSAEGNAPEGSDGGGTG